MDETNVILQLEGDANELLQVNDNNSMKMTRLFFLNPQSKEIGEEIIDLSITSTNEAQTHPIFDKLIDKKIRITVETLN